MKWRDDEIEYVSDQKINGKSVQPRGELTERREGEEKGRRGGAPPFNVGLRSARMETRANSITPPDSILLGSSAFLVEREGSASGKHPINKGRFYTRARVSPRDEEDGARVYMRAGKSAERDGCRGLKIRG